MTAAPSPATSSELSAGHSPAADADADVRGARRAASLIVLRDAPQDGLARLEVLMLRRAERDGDMRSGVWVFPGGVLDAGARLAQPVVSSARHSTASAARGTWPEEVCCIGIITSF